MVDPRRPELDPYRAPAADLRREVEEPASDRKPTFSDELKLYISELVRTTRSAEGVSIGASPRGALALMKTAQALALLDGSEFVTPDHIQELAVSVIAHRLVMDPQARFSGRTPEAVVQEILDRVPVPH